MLERRTAWKGEGWAGGGVVRKGSSIAPNVDCYIDTTIDSDAFHDLPSAWSELDEPRLMGRGRPKVLVRPQRWVACAVFLLLFGIFLSRALNPASLANSFAQFRRWPRESILGYATLDKDQRQDTKNKTSVEDGSAAPRVAICLVGGARAFELTGLTIKKYVLDVYEHADVFLHVPVDENSHKLTLLKDTSNKLAVARIFVPKNIPVTYKLQEVLTGVNSPNGVQGLLQYFSLVEGCLGMISWYEEMNGFKYDWIIRTRVDGYWRKPLPQLSFFEPEKYYIPIGSSFGGYNDRLGIGTRRTSWAALSRLSLIPKLHELGYRDLNSEKAFKAQLAAENITAEQNEFAFCILTSRKYGWPPGWSGVPVAAIQSAGNLNGAKCRLCHPAATGQYAMQVLSGLDPLWGWMGPVQKGVQLCNSTQDEVSGWEELFDEVSGPKLSLGRKKIKERSREECIQDIKEFGKRWELWEAPDAEELCPSS
ncbi:hypothetical protein R1sor_007463 [Riccia sorocarpa]|uniref:DUF7796 domain-containing protein n=1 Tax=Riccia sorocarpa TaxID=122646 RepID=A0ABD3HQJ4_9MARC